MNAEAFRHFYNYHFAENRKILEHVALLTFEQFTQKADYSRGSIGATRPPCGRGGCVDQRVARRSTI